MYPLPQYIDMESLFENNEVKAIYERTIHDSDDIEKLITDLKSLELSLLQTVFIVKKKLAIQLSDAREIVLNSSAWIDHKDSFNEFNNMVLDEFKKGADKVIEDENGQVSIYIDLNKIK